MTPEQLQTAYMAGRSHVSMVTSIDYDMRKHLAGLAEVARQQAEGDAQIAERQDYGSKLLYGEAPYADARARAIAAVIRAQFGTPDD